MKKYKITALVAAGIMAATAITVSAASNNSNNTFLNRPDNTIVGEDGMTDQEREFQRILNDPNTTFTPADEVENKQISVTHFDNTIVGEDGLTDQEREFQRILAENPVSTVTVDTDEFGIMTAANNDLTLEKVNHSSLGYPMWSRTFNVPDVSLYATAFSGPNYLISYALGKGNAMIEAKTGYKSMYKSVSSRAIYEKADGTRVTKRDNNGGTNPSYTAEPGVEPGAKLVRLELYYYIYDGDTNNTPYREVAVVNIVKS